MRTDEFTVPYEVRRQIELLRKFVAGGSRERTHKDERYISDEEVFTRRSLELLAALEPQ